MPLWFPKSTGYARAVPPTAFPELNDVLAELVRVYLQGAFTKAVAA
jgi:hypothetical protein